MPSSDATSRLRIVVLGYIVRGPLGGHAWHHLHYVAGLARLGHDVWFIEDSDDYPSCYDPVRDVTDTDPSYGIAFARAAFARVGLERRWAYYDVHKSCWHGPAAHHAPETCRSADLVLNLSGMAPLRHWLGDVPARVFVDTDPGFTQARHIEDGDARLRAAEHTAFFTFAENVGGSATLPDDGLLWQPTRQPVVTDLWPDVPPPREGPVTTVMLWDSYPPIEADGMRLGLKSDSFMTYLDLPARVEPTLELAVGSPTAPRELLRERGWQVVDARRPTRSIESYQGYIQQSRAEFTVAKHGYVATRSGWFSERSANYLSTGRPVVTQETGFSSWLPSGLGVLPFSTLDEATAAIAELQGRYEEHCKAAREIADEYFDSTRVLRDLIDRALTPALAAQ
jgi:hypothetical protein